MSKLMMLAGGMVEPGGGKSALVSAYVVLSAGRFPTRIFKVHGATNQPKIVELPAATTIDLGRFQSELNRDLAPTLERTLDRSSTASVTTPDSEWVCQIVRIHLKQTESLDVDA